MIGNQPNDCQSYLLHMNHEHRRMNHQLADVRELFQQAGTDRTVYANIAMRLHHLQDDLAKHFREEEAGGCIEEAACRCPSLTHEVSIIERQHLELKTQLAALITAVEQADSVSSADFEKFTQALDEHEELENHVLQRGFNTANEV